MSGAVYSEIQNQAPLNMPSMNLGGGSGIGTNPYTKIFGAALEDAGKWESDIGNALAKEAQAKAIRSAYQALVNYALDIANKQKEELENRAEKYDTKLQDQFNEAEPQYQQEANTQLAELGQLVNDISNQSAEAQRQNRRQINANLAQQGVRGGQAAILANRATGELNRDLQRDINQTVYNEALNRQNSRLNYYGQKAMTPWNTMSNAYGSSMTGANNALSNAQGRVYGDAYDTALNSYLGTQNTNGKGWKRYVGGWMQMSGNHAQNVGQKMQGI